MGTARLTAAKIAFRVPRLPPSAPASRPPASPPSTPPTMNGAARLHAPSPDAAEFGAGVAPEAGTPTSEDPIALMIGIPGENIRHGTIRKPPPMPKKPDNAPVPSPA